MVSEDDVRALMASLDGAVVVVGAEELGTPPGGIGDTFCTYDPGDGIEPDVMPFATIVTHDVAGWDQASDLDRDGAFRVNLNVGRGHVPPVRPDSDYAASDRLLPHPQYAVQGWVAIVNPGPATDSQLRQLLTLAHERAARRHRARRRS